jgi:hypothetical protein
VLDDLSVLQRRAMHQHGGRSLRGRSDRVHLPRRDRVARPSSHSDADIGFITQAFFAYRL